MAGSIKGAVKNKAGNGLSGALVTATDEGGSIYGPVATDVKGSYTIAGLAAAANYTLSVKAPRGFLDPASLKNVKVVDGQETAVKDLALDQISIGGRVIDKDGKGLQGRDVTVIDSQNAVAGKVRTDADGSYAFKGLAPGTYTVQVIDAAGQPQFLRAYNVSTDAKVATTGIDFAVDPVLDLTGRLDDARFSIESLISKEEAYQAISLFSVVNLMLAGLSRRKVGSEEKVDMLGMLNLFYGLQEDSLRDKLTVANSKALWSNLEGELKELAIDLDQLQSDVDFLNREAKRQFNLGVSNSVLANLQFPPLFKRLVEIGNDPLLSLDIKASDQPGSFVDKTKIAQADELLKELKSLILQLVRSLSKYGTAATRRVNEDWAKFEARALEVLSIVARDRVTPDQDEQNIWSVLAVLIDKNRETEIAPYVVLARQGGKLLSLGMDIYMKIESTGELDVFETARLRDLFQTGNIQTEFLTQKIRDQATVIKRYPLANWG